MPLITIDYDPMDTDQQILQKVRAKGQDRKKVLDELMREYQEINLTWASAWTYEKQLRLRVVRQMLIDLGESIPPLHPKFR